MFSRTLCALAAVVLGIAAPVGAQTRHFSGCNQSTDSQATVIIPWHIGPTVDGRPLSAGSEIAVFSQDGLCVGSKLWAPNDTTLGVAMTVWGDDVWVTRDVVDGLTDGEPLAFRIWDASTETEYGGERGEVRVTYDDSASYLSTDGLFAEGKIYRLASLGADDDVGTGTSIDRGGILPEHIEHLGNYPNPFRSATTIAFDLRHRSDVELTVSDLSGRRVAVLAAGTLPAGRHEVVWDEPSAPSGVYICRLVADGTSQMHLLLNLR